MEEFKVGDRIAYGFKYEDKTVWQFGKIAEHKGRLMIEAYFFGTVYYEIGDYIVKKV